MKFLEKPIVCAILILLFGIVPYANTFHSAFVFDDQSSIAENPVIRTLDNFFRNSSGYDYNPRRFVAHLTFALNYRFGDLDVTGYHATNLLIHLLNSLLVYSLVRLTFRTPLLRDSSLSRSANGIALFTALLFVAHPIQTQAVTYIVQRLTSLMALFYLSALVLYARWRLSPESGPKSGKFSAGFYVLSLACILLAMKTKENAFTLPAVLILYDLFFFDETILKRPRYAVPILLTLFIIPASLLHIDKPVGEILGEVGKVTTHKSTLTRWEYLLTQFSVVTTYIRLLFLPIRQNLDYDYPISHSLLAPRAAVSFLFLFSLFTLALLLFRRSRKGPDASASLVSFGILWFFITLAVESSVLPITDVIYEHRVYLPSAGAFVAIVGGIVLIGTRYRPEWNFGRLPFFALAVVATLAFTTYHRNAVWKDGVTLWRDVVDKSPGKVRGYNNLGAALMDSGRSDEAIGVLLEAISVKPDHADAYYNLGRAYLLFTDRTDRAIEMLRWAIALNPDYPEAHINLAAAYNKDRRFESTVTLLEKTMSAYKERPEAHFNLGVAYAYLRNTEGAARELEILRGLDSGLAAEFERFLSMSQAN